MSDIHGRLLIGGMTLKDLYGTVELSNDCQCSQWCGHLLVEPQHVEFLETGRRYRLELDDRRAGQIVVTQVECLLGQRKLRVQFNGISGLTASGIEHAGTGQIDPAVSALS